MSLNRVINSISDERFAPYLKKCNNNEQKALTLYDQNIEVSQSFYALLSILEITLRNKIDKSCNQHFNTQNWLQTKLPFALQLQISETEKYLQKSNKEITNSKIISELNFGFWTTLFNRKYAKLFWKPLHRIFANTPKQLKKRTEISSRLNHIRTFRNRIYHYEPIIWDISAVQQKHSEIFELIKWLDSDTFEWAIKFDQLNNIIKKYS